MQRGRQSPNRLVRSLPVVAGVVVAAAAVFVVRAVGYQSRDGAVASWTFATLSWLTTAGVAVDTGLAAAAV